MFSLRKIIWPLAAIVLALCSYAGLIALPSLIKSNPELLLCLRPTPEVILLIGRGTSALTSFAIAFPLRLLIHLIYFQLGRLYGEPILQTIQPGRAGLKLLKRYRSKSILLASLLLHQSTPVDVSLGILQTRLRTFAMALLPGTAFSTAILIAAGRGLASAIAPTVKWVTDHELTVSLGLAGLVVIQGIVTWLSWRWKARHVPETATDTQTLRS